MLLARRWPELTEAKTQRAAFSSVREALAILTERERDEQEAMVVEAPASAQPAYQAMATAAAVAHGASPEPEAIERRADDQPEQASPTNSPRVVRNAVATLWIEAVLRQATGMAHDIRLALPRLPEEVRPAIRPLFNSYCAEVDATRREFDRDDVDRFVDDVLDRQP
jgi:hypothetical protein